jgi:hypothetical protein
MNFTAIVLSAHLPRRDPINLGVLVLDEETNRIHLRFRTDLDGIVDSSDLEVIQGLPEMIESMAVEMSAVGVLQYLEDRASNVIRLGERTTIRANNATDAIESAFSRDVTWERLPPQPLAEGG